MVQRKKKAPKPKALKQKQKQNQKQTVVVNVLTSKSRRATRKKTVSRSNEQPTPFLQTLPISYTPYTVFDNSRTLNQEFADRQMLVKPKVSNTTLTPADVKQQVATNDEYDDTFTIDELNDYKKATYAKKQQENDAQNKAQKKLSETDSDTDSYSSSVKETIYRAELERRKEERNRYDAFLKARREQGYNPTIPAFSEAPTVSDILDYTESYRLPAADATAEMTNNPMRKEKAVKKYRCECGDRIANTPANIKRHKATPLHKNRMVERQGKEDITELNISSASEEDKGDY